MDEQIKPVGFQFLDNAVWSAVYSQQSIDALRAEVEFHKLVASALRSQMDVLRDGLVSERARAERAEAEAESLRADAERYRWLRQDAGFDGWTMPKPPAPCPDSIAGCKVQHHGREVSGAALDAAIDAARKGAEEVRYTITPKGREMLNGG